MNGVFSYRADSPYDDVPGERYHFPRQYLARVEQTVGDWIVFHELKGRAAIPGLAAYVSFARVARIDPDPQRADHYYARLSNAGTFGAPVPVAPEGVAIEAVLRDPAGGVRRGTLVNAVRLLDREEFAAIVDRAAAPARDADDALDGFEETATPFVRPVVETLAAQRAGWFRQRVLAVYGNRCALTAMRLVNGGGAVEVEAAHIRSVADGGPDLVPNGIALTRTVHWMFDRHLITFDESMNLIRTPLLSSEASRFLGNVTGLELPARSIDRPDPAFVSAHRAKTFAKVRRAAIGPS